MQADDELCLCFHISCRKVLNYIRIHQVKLPSQLAECGGAGTGCGWCRKQVVKLLIMSAGSPPGAGEIEEWLANNTPDRQKYAEARERYRAAKNQNSAEVPSSSDNPALPEDPLP